MFNIQPSAMRAMRFQNPVIGATEPDGDGALDRHRVDAGIGDVVPATLIAHQGLGP